MRARQHFLRQSCYRTYREQGTGSAFSIRRDHSDPWSYDNASTDAQNEALQPSLNDVERATLGTGGRGPGRRTPLAGNVRIRDRDV